MARNTDNFGGFLGFYGRIACCQGNFGRVFIDDPLGSGTVFGKEALVQLCTEGGHGLWSPKLIRNAL
jgi:hypothetical protein